MQRATPPDSLAGSFAPCSSLHDYCDTVLETRLSETSRTTSASHTILAMIVEYKAPLTELEAATISLSPTHRQIVKDFTLCLMNFCSMDTSTTSLFRSQLESPHDSEQDFQAPPNSPPIASSNMGEPEIPTEGGPRNVSNESVSMLATRSDPFPPTSFSLPETVSSKEEDCEGEPRRQTAVPSSPHEPDSSCSTSTEPLTVAREEKHTYCRQKEKSVPTAAVDVSVKQLAEESPESEPSPVGKKERTHCHRKEKNAHGAPDFAVEQPIEEPADPDCSQEHQSPETPESASTFVERILAMSIHEFIEIHGEALKSHSSSLMSEDTFRTLLMTCEANNEVQTPQWSDGSQWYALVEGGQSDRHKASIHYALTAVSFARWHEGQVALLEDKSPTHAAIEIASRILGPKPSETSDQEVWSRKRKNLATHLTRGRKWHRIVVELGTGLLLKFAWALGKSVNKEVDKLVNQIPQDSEKMAVISCLSAQVSLLVNNGRTDESKFTDDLASAGIQHSYQEIACFLDTDQLIETIRSSATTDELQVQGTHQTVSINSLKRLSKERWLNDNVILACLHLADKIDCVRVGFSVPLSRPTRKSTLQPFERASKLLNDWHKEAHPETRLICFFPVWQHLSHFSLLEINEISGYVYHYDSMQGESALTKEAVLASFPQFKYQEKEVIQQSDGHSCGPLVIRFARRRMLGLDIGLESFASYDPTELRLEAATILHQGWESNVLVAPQGRKRGSKPPVTDNGDKRQRV